MNLDEMKNALASDATRKAEKLEGEVVRLKHEIKRRDTAIAEQQDILRVMFNRCMAWSMGGLCMFCGQRRMCDDYRRTGGDENV